MLLSIIIPVYNVEPYIRVCLDSVVNQSCKDFEVIIVDDGSIDLSGNICDEYADKYANVHVFHTENKGASHARNVGIEHAIGEWISFVDADDWICHNYVASLEEANNTVDLIYFPLNQYYGNKDVITRYPCPGVFFGKTEIEKKLFELKYGKLDDIFGWTVVKFFKCPIIKEYQIRFVETIIFREDEIFTMDYCKHINSLLVLSTPLYYYRVRHDGITAKGMMDSDYLNLADNIERNLPFITYPEFISKEKQRIANYHIDSYIHNARFGHIWHEMNDIYFFFNQKNEYKAYASDRHLMWILNHTRLMSYLLLLLQQFRICTKKKCMRLMRLIMH